MSNVQRHGPSATQPVSESTPWRTPPQSLSLDGEQVHVWRASLTLAEPETETLRRTLTDEEVGKAMRYCFPRDRQRGIVARGMLRVILSRYMQVDPQEVRFCYGQHGKPKVAGQSGSNALRFNMAHGSALALYAVTRGRSIGVDIEEMRADLAADQIAERFFTASEVAGLRSWPVHRRREAFFRYWTLKEAYLKAQGAGLTLPLSGFSVSVSPGEAQALLEIDGDEQKGRWSLRSLDPGRGYAGALAVEGHGWRLECWQWTMQLAQDAGL